MRRRSLCNSKSRNDVAGSIYSAVTTEEIISAVNQVKYITERTMTPCKVY